MVVGNDLNMNLTGSINSFKTRDVPPVLLLSIGQIATSTSDHITV